MFGAPNQASDPKAYKFTTIFFLDYGKNYQNAPDGYVYAYGLDYNWREQRQLFLARVPAQSVMTRASWEFYNGQDAGGNPTWTADITQKQPVLTDDRLLYQSMFKSDCPADNPVIAQGGVVYDVPLNRYIFSSWSCATHEFYEASQPWGPWKHFFSHDFGPLRLSQNRGQYGTSIPSKFISDDGLTLYLQSNVCCNGDSYTFSLRKIYLTLAGDQSPSNALSSTDLATEQGTRAVSKSTHFGLLCGAGCVDMIATEPAGQSEDDWDEEAKTEDWWGYTWPQPYNLNQVTYTTGTVFSDGGWYVSNLRVQVRQNFQWVDVGGLSITPAYPYSNMAGTQTKYVFNFDSTWGDGVRIIGTPGGTSYFTSIGKLGAYYVDASQTGNGGFTLAVSPSTAAVTAGSATSTTISVTPISGFAQSVTFSCSGLPSKSQCSFSPSMVTLDGSAKATTKVTITTTAAAQAACNTAPLLPFGGGVVLVLCMFLSRVKKPGSFYMRFVVLGAALSLACASASSCGKGSTTSTITIPGTPSGNYPVIITASSGTGATAVVSTTTFTLTVQ